MSFGKSTSTGPARGLFMTHQHMPQARLGVQSVV
ncbi:Uncharacterised protein [Bordetella pertussis]|nr:Uncharacterised protein [Bordetella pertussis]